MFCILNSVEVEQLMTWISFVEFCRKFYLCFFFKRDSNGSKNLRQKSFVGFSDLYVVHLVIKFAKSQFIAIFIHYQILKLLFLEYKFWQEAADQWIYFNIDLLKKYFCCNLAKLSQALFQNYFYFKGRKRQSWVEWQSRSAWNSWKARITGNVIASF